MNPLAQLRRHQLWLRLNLPAAMLIALLQRTPVVRLISAAEEFVTASPVGSLLRSAVAAVASLGALHSLAGATTLASSSPGPVSVKTGTAITPVAFTVTDTINIMSWSIGGTIPPGLVIAAVEGAATLTGPGVLDVSTPGTDDGYGGMTGGMGTTTPVLRGTPTQAGNFTFTLQAFEFSALTGLASKTFNFSVTVAADSTAPAATPPSFSASPQSQSVLAGGSVTFSAAASGSPTPAFQWQKNGVAITGATNATLTLTNVQIADAGNYSVVATNSAGSVTAASVATLTVTPPATGAAPAFTAQPFSLTIASGSTVALSAVASGATTYQWRRNGTAIAGATGATLVLSGANASAGAYSVTATNTVGTTTSSTANLTISGSTDVGRLSNLSVLTSLAPSGDSFSLGYVVAGASSANAKPLVIRAVGPSLGALGVPGTISDPKMELFTGPTKTSENDNWGGSAGTTAAMAAVGAFAYTGAASLDAAVAANITSSDNSLKISAGASAPNATGAVIAEIYDATSGAFTAATPRLVNVSVLKQINSGATLTAGFVIGGSTARSVLVRAVGPTLAAFGVGGTMADPKLELFSGPNVIASNDNWGGDAQLTAAGNAVGAFAMASATSKDAILLITLAPGSYTAQASGIGGGGSALVEIYEVP